MLLLLPLLLLLLERLCHLGLTADAPTLALLFQLALLQLPLRPRLITTPPDDDSSLSP